MRGDALFRLAEVLDAVPRRVVACSGGVDSLLLADVAHELDPTGTVVAHSVTPAVPVAATERVERVAARLGWNLVLVTSGEFADERYLANPVDRCYFCKSSLYDELERIRPHADGAVVLSGANTDDLGEYRPGLIAAAEHAARHPFVEAGITKADVRAIARARGRDWHALPASPCLSSRLYTGTPVTPALVRAVEAGETELRRLTGIQVARCRVRGCAVLVEVGHADRSLVDAYVLARVTVAMRRHEPGLEPAVLDSRPYAPGRSFVGAGRLLPIASP